MKDTHKKTRLEQRQRCTGNVPLTTQGTYEVYAQENKARTKTST